MITKNLWWMYSKARWKNGKFNSMSISMAKGKTIDCNAMWGLDAINSLAAPGAGPCSTAVDTVTDVGTDGDPSRGMTEPGHSVKLLPRHSRHQRSRYSRHQRARHSRHQWSYHGNFGPAKILVCRTKIQGQLVLPDLTWFPQPSTGLVRVVKISKKSGKCFR